MEPINRSLINIDQLTQDPCYMDQDIIPYELIEMIMSYFDNMDLQQLSFVNKSWKIISLDTAIRREFSIKSFINLTVRHLDKHEETQNELKKIVQESLILKSLNLMDVKTSILDSQKKIIHILQDLEISELINLDTSFRQENQQNHPLLSLLQISKIYNEINNIKAINPAFQEKRLNKIIEFLIFYGHYEKSIEVIDKITHQSYKANSALTLTSSIIKIYKTEIAIKRISQLLLILSKENPHDSFSALAVCLDTLIKNNFFEEVIEFAEKTANFASEHPDFGNILGMILKYKKTILKD